MLKIIARLCCAVCLELCLLMTVTDVHAFNVNMAQYGTVVIADAVSNGGYDNSTMNVTRIINGFPYVTIERTGGLRAVGNTSNFSVDAHGICRYIDVATTPHGPILIPFDSPAEWIGSGNGVNNKGFIATNAMQRSFVKLDFCRRPEAFAPVDFGDTAGISIYQPTADAVVAAGNARTNISPIRVQPVAPADQVRIDTRSDAAFFASLLETRAQDFSLSRQDCLGNTTYPDGSVRNPCFTWSWVEKITATFTDNIGMNRVQAAAAASGLPATDGTNSWSSTLVRTACTGPNGMSNELPPRPLPNATCPPAVQPPTLGNCTPAAHNTHSTWQPQSYNQVRHVGCPAGYVEGPTRNEIYDVEVKYWCFDSVNYPDGTQEVNIRQVGTCAPIINAQVGPVNGTSVDSLNSNSSGLCNVGTVDAFTVTATGWSWTCKGANTGNDAFGTANQHMAYNLACSTADSTLSGTPANYSCDKFNSSGSTCAGTQTLTGLPGCCKTGQSNTASFSVSGFTVSGCNAPGTSNVWAWGTNAGGELGNNTTINSGNSPSTFVPVNVLGGNTYQSLNATSASSMAVKTDGTLWQWGNGANLPVQTAGAAVATAVGTDASLCVLRTDAKVYCGNAQQTQVTGDWKMITGTSGSVRLVPVLDTANVSTQPAASVVNTCGIRTDNTAWCWNAVSNGAGSFTQLPDADWLRIDMGADTLAAIKVDGMMWAASDNAQLTQMPGRDYTVASIGGAGTIVGIRGANELFSATIGNTPIVGGAVTQVANLQTATGTFVAAAADATESCALKDDGTGYCFTNINSLQPLPNGQSFSSIKAGSGHFLAIAGTPVCLQITESRTSTACPLGQTGVITEERTKHTGGVCGAYGNWTPVSNTCTSAPTTYGWDISPWTPGVCPVTPTPATVHFIEYGAALCQGAGCTGFSQACGGQYEEYQYMEEISNEGDVTWPTGGNYAATGTCSYGQVVTLANSNYPACDSDGHHKGGFCIAQTETRWAISTSICRVPDPVYTGRRCM